MKNKGEEEVREKQRGRLGRVKDSGKRTRRKKSRGGEPGSRRAQAGGNGGKKQAP